MSMPLRLRHAAINGAVTALVVLSLGGCQSMPAKTAASLKPDEVALIQDAVRQVQRHYVQPVADDKLVTDALRGMLTGLDPHSDYMDEREYQQTMREARGRFAGLGIDVGEGDRVPKVVSLADGTPAARAGIAAGDLIVKVDGAATDGMTLDDMLRRLRGRAGTSVTLTIARPKQAPFDVALTRAVIRIASVISDLERNKIGYVRIDSFSDETPEQLNDAIDGLVLRADGRLNGFVLDLRNNRGGMLNSAVAAASDFLQGGTIVTIRGRDNSDQVYGALPGGDRIQGVPMVVLINSATASASEIVAGALQDRHRATVMGTGSFGKGSVQTILPLNGHGALRLTTELYYTPAGRSIQAQGIVPDVVVGLPKDEQDAKRRMYHEADLPGALKNVPSLAGGQNAISTVAPAVPRNPNGGPIDPVFIGTDKDEQLKAAIQYLEKAGTVATAGAQRPADIGKLF